MLFKNKIIFIKEMSNMKVKFHLLGSQQMFAVVDVTDLENDWVKECVLNA